MTNETDENRFIEIIFYLDSTDTYLNLKYKSLRYINYYLCYGSSEKVTLDIEGGFDDYLKKTGWATSVECGNIDKIGN